MPIPMMLPITRAVDCGSPSRSLFPTVVVSERSWIWVMALLVGGLSSIHHPHQITQRRAGRRDEGPNISGERRDLPNGPAASARTLPGR